MAQALLRQLAFVATGTTHFTQAGYEKARRAPWWEQTHRCLEGDRPLRGKLVAITGANAGLGAAVAEGVARLGATTLLLCRSLERGRAAADAIKQRDPQAVVEVEQVDVSSLASIAAFAARFCGGGGGKGGKDAASSSSSSSSAARPLHCLVNNAGILPHERRLVEPEGFESSFATNVAGTMALTLALKPALLRAAQEAAAASAANGGGGASSGEAAATSIPRVVFVSSGGMYTDPLRIDIPLDPHDASAPATTPPFNGVRAYSRDKRRQVALAEALGRRWARDGILVASYHPGWADTPGVQTALPAFRAKFEGKLRQPEGGADTAVWMAAAPAGLGGGGGGGGSDDASVLAPGEFYLDRRPQPKHLLGASGRVAGTSYTPADADLLLERVVGLLKEKGATVAV
jgi:dehydrogenase/reductase SDR family protein 12